MGIANIINNSTTTSGGEIVRELVNSSDGQGLHFDGSAGAINLGSSMPDLGSKYSLEFVVKGDARTGEVYLLDAYNSSSTNRVILAWSGNSNGNIQLHVNGTWSSAFIATPDNGEVLHLLLSVDGTSATLYQNGNSVSTQTVVANTMASATSTHIGCSQNGTANYFNGTIYRARFYNRTLSADDVRTAFERADVDYSSQYGSQTELVTNGDFASATGWSQNNVTIAGDGNAVWAVSGGDQWVRRADWNITKGKKYRITVVSSAHTTNGSFQVFTYGATSTIATTDLNGDAFTISGTGTHIFEFEALADSASGVLFGRYPTGAAYVGTITDLSCVQIGCVSDYQTQWANPTQSRTVQDASGAADGTCSASGVTQVQPVVQLNAEQLSVGGTNAKIGIGLAASSSPQEMLHIDGISPRIRLRDSDASGTPISTIDASGGDILISADANDETAGSDVRLATDGTTHLTLDSSGNVTQTATTPALIVKDTQDKSWAENDALGSLQFHTSDTSGVGAHEIAGIHTETDEAGTNTQVAGAMVFKTAPYNNATPVERMRIASGGLCTFANGIAFSQTNSTAASNITATLDHYERGVWTPVIADAVSGGNTASAAIKGYYTRIGNLVTVNASMTNIDTSGMTGANDLFIRGLPFPAGYSAGTYSDLGRAFGACQLDDINVESGCYGVNTVISPLTSYLKLAEMRDANNDDRIIVSELNSGTADIFFTTTYFVD